MNHINKMYGKVYVALIALMVIVRDIGNVPINKYVIVVVCAALFLVQPIDDIVMCMAFTFPLLCGLPGNYIMPVAFMSYLIKQRCLKKIQFGYIAFIVLMELLTFVIYGNNNLVDALGYIVNACIFFVLLYQEDLDYERLIRYYILGVVLVCSVIVIVTFKNTSFGVIATGSLRIGEVEKQGENALRMSLNANALSYYSIAGISCITVLLFKGKTKNYPLMIIGLIILSVAGVLTLSRTWFIDFALLVALVIIASSKEKGKGIRSSLILLGLLFAGYQALKLFPNVYQSIVARFNNSNIATGNSRTIITSEYLQAFWSKLEFIVFGTGVSDYSNVIGQDRSLHNSIIQILVCYGIAGFFVFMSGWINSFRRYLGSTELIFWIPLICNFVYCLTAQMVNPSSLLFPHLIAVFAVKMGGEWVSIDGE